MIFLRPDKCEFRPTVELNSINKRTEKCRRKLEVLGAAIESSENVASDLMKRIAKTTGILNEFDDP